MVLSYFIMDFLLEKDRNENCHFVEFLQIITAILMDFAHNKRALTQLLKAKKGMHWHYLCHI